MSGGAAGAAAAALQAIARELLETCSAARVTIRLESPDDFFPVVAEARTSDVGSIAGVQRTSLERMSTFRFVADERRTLVQNDCLDSEVETPREVVETYGIRAQVLVPILRGGQFCGAISIHETRGTRDWSGGDIRSAEEAAIRISDLLGEGSA